MAPGLRERRKHETRQAISDIATQMFVARGFDLLEPSLGSYGIRA